MYKKTITYTDYNGNKRTEDVYFHLNESELMKMEMGVKGGYTEYVKRIIDAQDQPSLIKIFEDLIQLSYGVKDLDGRGFRKSPAALEDFMATPMYSILFMELATDEKAASEFINGVIPADLAKRLKEKQLEAPSNN